MTRICGFVDPEQQWGLLGADGANLGLSEGRVEKTRLLLGRWIVAAWGSSLILAVLDEIAYFNDKSISFSVNSLADLQDQIASIACVLVPQISDQLASTGIKEHLQRHLLETPTGLAVLDRNTFSLVSIQYPSLKHLAGDPDSARLETVCENGMLWSMTMKTAKVPMTRVPTNVDDVVKMAAQFLQGDTARTVDFSYISLARDTVRYKPLWENPESKCQDAFSKNTCLVMENET
jgi:hypothetical protein